jgi:hypothetical protein
MYDWTNYIKPFNENEVKDRGLSNICRRSLIQKHEKSIAILDAIMRFERRKKRFIESISGFSGTYPNLRVKYVNNIDTINRCIKRLEKSYKRILMD